VQTLLHGKTISIVPTEFMFEDVGVHHAMSGFGGLVVSMLASGTQDHGFVPGFFRAKNSQHAFLPKGSKAVCPMSKNPIT
jgi:hypothetical protein